MTDYPDDIATIIRMRAERQPEGEIARALGMDRKQMWQRVRRWNERNPTRAVPRPASRPATLKYETSARMVQQGATVADIARETGTTLEQARRNIRAARQKGLLPPRGDACTRTGADIWVAHARKGAAPPLGRVGLAMANLTEQEGRALLALTRPEDASAADLLVRLAKEHLDAQKPRG